MARTPSTMLPLGTKAPDFLLADPRGKQYRLADFESAPLLLVMFICNHCPYVVHLKAALAARALDWQKRGVAIVAINSNDSTEYPQDSPVEMLKDSATFHYSFPYLVDETQSIARAYKAACTPDFFLFDQSRELIYRGQFDDSRPSNREPITGADLERAIGLGLQGFTIPDKEQAPSMGCNIKWRRSTGI